MSTSRPTRAVLYSRVSTMMQAEQGVSLEMQEQMARDHCERQGWVYLGAYTDTISGTKDSRDQLARLEADAEARRFDVALVYKTDRLARSLLKLLQIAADFSDRGIGLISLTEPIDFTTPMGKALLAMLGAFAEMESQNIGTRVRDSLRQVAARGGHTGATSRALGYRWDKEAERLVVVPEEAITVRAIFDSYLRLRTLRATAGELNAGGYRTLEGRTFSVAAVRWIIDNPIYQGALVWGRTTAKKNSKGARRIAAVPVERWVTHEGAHEAIIDADIWKQAQALLKDNQRKPARAVYGRANYAWSGLIVCSGCGGPAVRFNSGSGRPRPDGTRYRVTGYECISRKNKGHGQCDSPCYLTDVFLDEVAVPALAGALAARLGERPKARGRKPARRDFAAEIDARRAEVARAWEGWVKGRITEADAERIAAEAEAEIARLSAASGLEAAPADAPLPALGDFGALWKVATEPERGDMLRLCAERVSADKGEVVFHFRPEVGLAPLAVERVSLRGWHGKQSKGKPRAW